MKKVFAFALIIAAIMVLEACNGRTDWKESGSGTESGTGSGTEDDPKGSTKNDSEKCTGSDTEDSTGSSTKDDTEDNAKSDTETARRTVTDHLGNTVVLPENIDRILVCDIYPLPAIISMFFNSADRLVGIASQSMSAAKAGILGKLYPEILKAETGFINGTNLNIEEVIKLSPDIVFYNAGNKAEGELLKKADIPAVAISAGKWGYDALETLAQWVKTLSEVFVENGKFEKVRDYNEKIKELVDERLAGITESEKKTVFFLFQYNESTLVTSGNPSFGSYWINAVHAINPVKEKTEANSLQVNMEQVYIYDPDVIFITNFTNATEEDIYENKIGNYDWSETKAVKNREVYKMPLGFYRSYTSGADSPITLLWIAKQVYPEYFEDIDIEKTEKEYYAEVFGVR